MINMDPQTTGDLLRNLLTVAWLLPLLGFVAEIYWLRWSHRLSKSAALCAVACIGLGFLCSFSALMVWGNATGWAALSPVEHHGSAEHHGDAAPHVASALHGGHAHSERDHATDVPADAAAGAVPAAAKPAVAAAARPSVQDMLKAVREGKAVAAAPAAGGPKGPVAAPPAPVKPAAAAKKAPSPQRRSLASIVVVACISLACFIGSALTSCPLLFLAGMLVWSFLMTPFMAAWAAMAEVTSLWTLHTARFMMPNVLVEPPSKFKVGPLSDYPLNTVSNKWKDQYGVWIVHTDQYEGQNLVFALASVCTHLGCTPSWLDGEQKFKCPCHGSGFYMTGVNFEGPAPRPLERMGVRIAEGMLEVDKSVKFQEEMGQWVDPASFVPA